MDTVTFPGPAGRLEGRFFGQGTRMAVMASPHPLMGGSMDTPPGRAAIDGLVDAGLCVLAFEFRGVGQSEGLPSGETTDADDDFRAALRFAAERGDVVCVAGYSFGGAAALRVSERETWPVVALAPPPMLFPEEVLERLGRRARVVVGGSDGIAQAATLVESVTRYGGIVSTVEGGDHFFSGALDHVRRFAKENAVD